MKIRYFSVILASNCVWKFDLDLLLLIRTQENKAFFLEMDFGKVPVYCHMTNSGLGACGGGGWTLVMKINGTKVSRLHGMGWAAWLISGI